MSIVTNQPKVIPDQVTARYLKRLEALGKIMEDTFYRMGVHAIDDPRLKDDPFTRERKKLLHRCLQEYNYIRTQLAQEDRPEEAYNPFKPEEPSFFEQKMKGRS